MRNLISILVVYRWALEELLKALNYEDSKIPHTIHRIIAKREKAKRHDIDMVYVTRADGLAQRIGGKSSECQARNTSTVGV